ncbi:MAG: glycoside hydrolase family 3 protein [Patescibacteria group bacterium]
MAKKIKKRTTTKWAPKKQATKNRVLIFIKNHKLWTMLLFVVCIFSIGLFLFFTNDDFIFESSPPPPPVNAKYKQASVSIDLRVEDLLAWMTLEEKIGQMALVDKNSIAKLDDVSRFSIGGMLSGAGAKPKENTPQGWRNMINDFKNQAKKSRLGIPILYGVDANHGHANVPGATIFPHSIGLGATRDPKLVQEIAELTKLELAATGVNWTFSPSLDAPTDIRWGRVYEALSVDHELNAKIGSLYIIGTQSTDGQNSSVLATAKHYLGTGSMKWGQSNHKKFKIDQGKISINEDALNNQYLPPFKAAVDSGVASVMIGLNQWGNHRIIDSQFLITEKLKGELGFKGFVVSDWFGVYEYSKTSNYQANINTINAGLDMAMLPFNYKSFIKDVRKAVHKGEISQLRIDDAVRRILYQKFKAGLFDKSETNNLEIVGSEKHRNFAKIAVSKSVVLLKNENSLLPLSKNIGPIFVAGSGADNVGRQSGAWTIEWQGVDGNWIPNGTSILQGFKNVIKDTSSISYQLDGNFERHNKIAEVGIAVISEKPYAEGWGDNPYPTIDPKDLKAIANIKKFSKKTMVIILSGRPLFLPSDYKTWDSILAAWLPGSEGAGIAEVVFGVYPTSGKLPITWPANIEQLPINLDTTFNNSEPLFERNFGL